LCPFLGVRIVGFDTILSASVDQMLKFWTLSERGLEKCQQIYTDVADVSNIETWESE